MLPDVRTELIERLDHMTTEQITTLLNYAEVMLSHGLAADYDPDHDPAVGFLSGSTNLAQQAKAILRDEISRKSGWTQKKD